MLFKIIYDDIKIENQFKRFEEGIFILRKLKSEFDLPLIFVGDGVEANKKILEEEKILFAPEHLNYQSAENIILCAKKMLSDSNLKPESKYIFDYADFLPFYLRKPEAEQKLKES